MPVKFANPIERDTLPDRAACQTSDGPGVKVKRRCPVVHWVCDGGKGGEGRACLHSVRWWSCSAVRSTLSHG